MQGFECLQLRSVSGMDKAKDVMRVRYLKSLGVNGKSI